MANFLRTKCLLHKTFILLVLLMEATKWCACSLSNNSSTLKLGCKVSEREALLKFKHSLSFFDPNVSSTWEGDDCCKWRRVGCDPTTGDVVKLQLHGRQCPQIMSETTSDCIRTENLETSLQQLKELKHLEHLDISYNYFETSPMPKALGSMQQLRYLNLSFTSFRDESPDVLSNLTHLQVLDLNSIKSSLIHHYDAMTFSHLGWVSSLRELQYLDMSLTNLSLADDWVKSLFGPLPSLRELRLTWSSLPTFDRIHQNSPVVALPIRYLDLGRNRMGGDIPLWLSKLHSLVHLDLSDNCFTSIVGGNIWGLVHNLCRLRLLDLSGNNLRGNLLEPHENVSTICTHHDLQELDLSYNNNLNGNIPSWLGENFQSLKKLDLSRNQLSGQIPTSFGNLIVLKELYLHDNKLSQISSLLNFPSSLEEIDLSSNNLTGQIPKSLGNLSKLQSLKMNSNPLLEGTVMSETHFSNLSKLANLDLSNTYITLKLPLDWVPSFQLSELSIGTCKINGPFPQWLQTQKSLQSLILSNARIYGEIPKWFHTMQKLRGVDLSHNHINGSLIFPIKAYTIDFSKNSFSGPYVLSDIIKSNVTYPSATVLDLSSNLISGQLPGDIGRGMPNLFSLDLSNNQINGPIPKSISQLRLGFLNLQKNRLSGTIPKNIGVNIPIRNTPGSQVLIFVDLSSNKLNGNIPCFGPAVAYLHISNNRLSGKLPPCLMNDTGLQVLDVGGNELSGNIPAAWFSKAEFSPMMFLRLRENKLSGSIPRQLCSFPYLQILDLARNHFSGTIPYCLSNLTAMRDQPGIGFLADMQDDISNGFREINAVIKGIERGYTSTLEYLVNIDLSCNELVGNIPDSISNLSDLVGLNLSYNQLSGVIPQRIGAMKSLESLDLSNNKLWGTIPTSMADLNGLSYLNLSYNNFSGHMPTGNQLQTLDDPSSYAGNPFLCGEFLPKKCKKVNGETNGLDNNKNGQEDEDDGDNKHETLWFYLVVMTGFATGFWGVVGTLLLQRGWRHALFRHVEDGYDWFHVVISVRVAWLKKMWNGSSNESIRSG